MTGHARISIAAWGATVLGSLVLTPVFSGPFLFISAFLCALVTGVGVLLQNLRTPRIVVPIVQLLVLIELLSLFFLHSTMKFGLFPLKATAIEFNAQLVDAMDSINRFSAPLPQDSHLTLFAVSVISATGFLIHVIAVQLRQAAWSGLLLLIMYTVPAATVHGGLPWLLFIPPAIGYIVLLSAEGRSRLSRWGRRISGVSHLDAAEPVEASALGQAGRRIGLTVVAIAALLPALLPTLPEGVIGNGLAGGGTGSGIGASISSTDPMLDMGKNLKRGDNVVALTYKGGPTGGTYLRLTALDLFDGNTWRIAPRSAGHKLNGGELTPPPGYTGDLTKVQQSSMEIDVTRTFRSQFVPVPYPLHSISLKRDWRYDAGALDVVSSNGSIVGGKKYKLTSYDLQPTPDQLHDSITTGAPDQYTMVVPQKTPLTIKQKTAEITAAAKDNKFEAAVLIQNWFRSGGGFTYSTQNAKGSGMAAIEDFLLNNKEGYCEQFATGMALMARIIGIPSRVGIGFLPGTAGKDGEFTVKMHDMHAWPELYFQGIGWVRFEPTPSARVAATPNWTVASNENPTSPTTAPTNVPTTPGQKETPGIDKPKNDPNLPNDSGTAIVDSGNWFTNGGAKAIAGGLGVVLLLCIPWLVRTLTRRRRFLRPPGRAGAEGLWAEIRDTSRDLGLDWSEISTPRQAGHWLASQLPEETHPAARRLARGIEGLRYAGDADPELDLRDDASAVRQALWTRARARRRWRARLLPPSWRWYLSRGTTEASDLLDEFDLLLARLRSFILPKRARTN
ncbi:transglutaminaseTgpA domain-containing protein [Kribbella soli]|uniref:Transglutaminase domain-containing protein n=1 Tax=Kribbella soli TaxID=1124743 RepID=A0A4R0H699_9ACTN|nr:transglutaminaseTgpA domain-containing protein [Kribbella soli]TCC05433.1 transglutaminase domain-containing protein [Kribbella soli]